MPFCQHATSQKIGALCLQRNYHLHRALAGKADSGPAATLVNSPSESIMEDYMEEDDAGPSGSASEEEEVVDMVTAGKRVSTFPALGQFGAWGGPQYTVSGFEAKACIDLPKQGKRGRCTEKFKEMVLSTLQRNGYEGLRSAKLTLDDFLKLLAIFNQAGIHFSA